MSIDLLGDPPCDAGDPPVPPDMLDAAPSDTGRASGPVPPITPMVARAEVVTEPSAIISPDRVLARMEGITAGDRAAAVVLGQRALAIQVIADDATEVQVGALIDELTEHQAHIERKIRPFADIAYKLHRALTGFLSNATQDLTAGLAHLRPMLAKRLREKQDAELARVRAEQAKALEQQQARLRAEAEHMKAVGEAPEAVQAVLDEAKTLPPPPVAERPITTLKGASTRDNWKADVVDKRAVILHVAERLAAGDQSLLHLLDVSTTTANQLARAQKATMQIPGLRAVNDVAFTKRRSS
jgi:hypothetical protein